MGFQSRMLWYRSRRLPYLPTRDFLPMLEADKRNLSPRARYRLLLAPSKTACAQMSEPRFPGQFEMGSD